MSRIGRVFVVLFAACASLASGCGKNAIVTKTADLSAKLDGLEEQAREAEGLPLAESMRLWDECNTGLKSVIGDTKSLLEGEASSALDSGKLSRAEFEKLKGVAERSASLQKKLEVWAAQDRRRQVQEAIEKLKKKEQSKGEGQ